MEATEARVEWAVEMVAWAVAGGTGEGPTVTIDNSTNKIEGLQEMESYTWVFMDQRNLWYWKECSKFNSD
ncbi:hypothetical protein MSAN_00131500 [Mycena sanguinolenta]|uniref:Uncharacterized protein n=1 Tax=Mycena sanguinolenta TaxID=230812 RepID=A0A8H7DK35_9AGAR|nr:hypothetical protein MSAN_00131500 [Mycena sanguinolenta]